MVDQAIPESLRVISQGYYHDLGADLTTLESFTISIPLARRRWRTPTACAVGDGESAWRPAIARVSANYGTRRPVQPERLCTKRRHAVHFVRCERSCFTYNDSCCSSKPSPMFLLERL